MRRRAGDGCSRRSARFIAAGRLNFSIDRVNGVVETNRPVRPAHHEQRLTTQDARNARYEQVVKQGDALLNNLSRVSRAISS